LFYHFRVGPAFHKGKTDPVDGIPIAGVNFFSFFVRMRQSSFHRLHHSFNRDIPGEGKMLPKKIKKGGKLSRRRGSTPRCI